MYISIYIYIYIYIYIIIESCLICPKEQDILFWPSSHSLAFGWCSAPCAWSLSAPTRNTPGALEDQDFVHGDWVKWPLWWKWWVANRRGVTSNFSNLSQFSNHSRPSMSEWFQSVNWRQSYRLLQTWFIDG